MFNKLKERGSVLGLGLLFLALTTPSIIEPKGY